MGVADDTLSRIAREMYDDWLERFWPRQKEFMEKTQSGELLSEQLERTTENLESASESARLGETNRNARYGVSGMENPNQSSREALTSVNAKNTLRDVEKERSMSILGGSGGLRGMI